MLYIATEWSATRQFFRRDDSNHSLLLYNIISLAA